MGTGRLRGRYLEKLYSTPTGIHDLHWDYCEQRGDSAIMVDCLSKNRKDRAFPRIRRRLILIPPAEEYLCLPIDI